MPSITTRRLLAALAPFAIAVAAGCDSTLTTEPTTEVAENEAIIDAGSARAALAGAYDELQDGYYYGGSYLFFTELPTDNADHVGTFTTYADLDQHVTAADNSEIEGIWDHVYEAIGRANTLIARIPAVTALDDAEKDDIIGQAHALRALHYHNLVRLWGPVPIRLEPPPNLDELTNTERSSVEQVYTQILSDLSAAEALMSDEERTRKISKVAVQAIRSRVMLYQKNWAGAEAAANAVIDAGVELAPSFSDLFHPEGNDTPEDIFRTSFTATEYNLLGYYYITRSLGGRRELAPTRDLLNAFEPGDERGTWSIQREGSRLYGAKFPTTVGAEDLHVIRFGEVLLNLAEAQAMLGKLAEAVAAYNQLRVRAGVPEHVLGTDVTTQQEVVEAIWAERRRELAFEGDRWPDLVRTERAAAILEIPQFRTLFPIPQNELDVAPRLVQNAGY
jgi:hypothetical protein